MKPKLIVYIKGEDQPEIEATLQQFDPEGNPTLYFADIEGDVIADERVLRVFVELEPK